MARLTFDYGLNETESTSQVEAQEGYNFDLELGGTRLFPRRGIDLKGSLAFQNVALIEKGSDWQLLNSPNALHDIVSEGDEDAGGPINGLMQLIKRDDTETTLVYQSNPATPTIYKWTGSNTETAFTSVRTTNVASASLLRDVYWSLDEYITITDINKLTPLLNWDGTSCTRQKTGLTQGSAASVTLTCSSGTVTATATSHAMSVGDLVTIADANETLFNGEHEVTSVPSANAFEYEITSCPTSTATGTITFDAGVDLYAKYGIIFNNRMWLFNITTGSTENPHMILASAFENPESYDTVNRSGVASGNSAFYTLTPDLKPINGVAQFNKQLIISTVDGAIYRLNGTDAADYEFVTYFSGSASLGDEGVANIGNDVLYVREGGNIDLLSTTDTSGDVRADDISRWIPTTIDSITSPKVVYDQHNQKVLIFYSDKILVLFKDKLIEGGGSPWTVYRTRLDDGFQTNAARYMRRPGESTYTVYFGDSSGNIFDLNGSGLGDNGQNIEMTRRTALIDTERKNIMRGNVQYRRLGEVSMTLTFDWANEYNETSVDLMLKGPPGNETFPVYGGTDYYNSTAYYNEGFKFANKVSRQNYSPSGRSESFFLRIDTDTDIQYQVDHIAIME